MLSRLLKYIYLKKRSTSVKIIKFIKKNIRFYRIKKFKKKIILILSIISVSSTVGLAILIKNPILILFLVLLCLLYYYSILDFKLNLNLRVLIIITFLFKNTLNGIIGANLVTCLSISYIVFMLYLNIYATIIKN